MMKAGYFFRAFLTGASIFMAFVIIPGCRKEGINTTQLDSRQAHQLFYGNLKDLNFDLRALVNSFKKQTSFNENLASFIEKNGVPVWDKTIYSTKSSKATKTGNVESLSVAPTSTAKKLSSEVANETDGKGMFFIPLKSQISSEIQSYIVALKHDDSTYSYKLYNKDSLARVHPVSDSAKKDLINLFGVFGAFEKTVNGRDSTIVNSPNKAVIKHSQMHFVSDSLNTDSHVNMLPGQGFGCIEFFYVNISFEYMEIGNGYAYYAYGSFSMLLAQAVQCPGTGDEEDFYEYNSEGEIGSWSGSGLGYNFYQAGNTPLPWWDSGTPTDSNIFQNGGNSGGTFQGVRNRIYDLYSGDGETDDGDSDNLTDNGPTANFPQSMTLNSGHVVTFSFGTTASDNQNADLPVSQRLIDAVRAALEEADQLVVIKSLHISATTNGAHDPQSNHYKGLAVDISQIDGIPVIDINAVDKPDSWLHLATLQTAFDRVTNRRENFGPYFKHKLGVNFSVGGHQDHVHFSVNGQ